MVGDFEIVVVIVVGGVYVVFVMIVGFVGELLLEMNWFV